MMEAPFTFPFDTFWNWLTTHPNCIIRGGSVDSVLYDDEDLHWYFLRESDGVHVVQLLRGKRLVGELFIEPERVDYVQSVPPQVENEHVFEMISEQGADRIAAYYFVLIHGWEEEQTASAGRVH